MAISGVSAPVGALTKVSDRWYIKTSNGRGLTWSDRWTPLARYVYEQSRHTKLKPGEHVVFLNGNPNNFRYENLAKVSDGEQAIMNRQHLYDKNAQITQVGIVTAKLIKQTTAVERRLVAHD